MKIFSAVHRRRSHADDVVQGRRHDVAGAMPVQPRTEGQGWKRPAVLVALGCFALFIGLLVYLTDRDVSRSVLMPRLATPGGHHLFGTLGSWLPSLLHVLAFGLFMGAILEPATPARIGVCAFWGAVNVAFEVGQHTLFKPHWAEALRGGAGDWAISRAVLNYEFHGSFDSRDIGAAVLGALAANLVIYYADRIQETPHART